MALRFHPDKALTHCRFAERLGQHGAPIAEARSIEERIRAEADWLFKCIGEALTVLSDTRLRAEVCAASLMISCVHIASGERGGLHVHNALVCICNSRCGQYSFLCSPT